jgi:hypothetical protein
MKTSRYLTLLLTAPLLLALLVPVVGCRTTKAQQDTTQTPAPPDGQDPSQDPDPNVPPDTKPKRKPPGKTLTAR